MTFSNGIVVRAIKQSCKQVGDKGQVGNLRKSKAAMAMDRLHRETNMFREKGRDADARHGRVDRV